MICFDNLNLLIAAIENVSQELGQLYQSEKPYNLRTMLQTLESRLRRR